MNEKQKETILQQKRKIREKDGWNRLDSWHLQIVAFLF